MLMYIKGNLKSGKKRPSWSLKLSIANTKLEPLKNILDWYDGSITLGKNNNPNQKDHYAFVAYSKKALEILKDIAPYLKIKKRHAEIIFKYYEILEKSHGCKGVPKEIQEQKIELALELKDLNHRGIIKKEPIWIKNLF